MNMYFGYCSSSPSPPFLPLLSLPPLPSFPSSPFLPPLPSFPSSPSSLPPLSLPSSLPPSPQTRLMALHVENEACTDALEIGEQRQQQWESVGFLQLILLRKCMHAYATTAMLMIAQQTPLASQSYQSAFLQSVCSHLASHHSIR